MLENTLSLYQFLISCPAGRNKERRRTKVGGLLKENASTWSSSRSFCCLCYWTVGGNTNTIHIEVVKAIQNHNTCKEGFFWLFWVSPRFYSPTVQKTYLSQYDLATLVKGKIMVKMKSQCCLCPFKKKAQISRQNHMHLTNPATCWLLWRWALQGERFSVHPASSDC